MNKEDRFKNIKANKAWIALGLVALLLIASFNVFGVTRTITDTSDTIDTYIRNSNGNYYAVTGANIQAAIDDIGSGNKGTVTCPGNTTISVATTIDLSRNVTLDLGGCSLYAGADTNIIQMYPNSILRNGNFLLDTVDGFSKAAVYLDGDDNFDFYWDNAAGARSQTYIENINVVSKSQDGYGLHFYCPNTEGNHQVGWVSVDGYSSYATNKSIFFENLYSGSGNGAWINGNTLSNMKGYKDGWFIYLDGQMQDGTTEPYTATSGNIFNNIMVQHNVDEIGVIYIEGYGNIFDNVIIWDWDNDHVGCPDARNSSIYFSGVSKDTIVSGSHGISSYRNVDSDYWFTNIVVNDNMTVKAVNLATGSSGRGINPGWDGATGVPFYYGTKANPYTYWYGDVSGSTKYGAMRVDTVGNWDFFTQSGAMSFEPSNKIVYIKDMLDFTATTSSPATSDGRIAYADGVGWDPGSGEGVYCYYNSSWNKL